MTRASMTRAFWPYLAVSVCFVVSRWVYRNVYGVAFDPSPVDFFIQYMDPWFFERDFARSLLFLHHQAPLQNALVGGAVKLLGSAHAWFALELVYALFGYCTVLGLLHVALGLGARPVIASFISALYAMSPATVVYENWLLYHVPVTCCLVLAAVALLRYYRVRTFGAAFAYFSAIAAAALFRSTFGPVFLLVALAPPLLALPIASRPAGARRILISAVALPLVLLTMNSLKPLVLIGHGYGETFFWGNVSAKVKAQLPPAELARLVAQGKVSKAVDIFCLADLNQFGDLRIKHAKTGVPLLDMDRVPGGRANPHALEYLLLSEKYYEPDARYLVAHYPDAYVRSVLAALTEYTGSTINDTNLPGTGNYTRVSRVSDAIDRVFGRHEGKSLTLVWFGLPALLVFGAYRAVKSLRLASQRATGAVLGYMLLTIAYVSSVSLLISCGDFSRYRFDIDPLHLILLALLLTDFARACVTRGIAAAHWIVTANAHGWPLPRSAAATPARDFFASG